MNLLEFALGRDPDLAEAGQRPVASIASDGGNDYLSITFRRQAKALDLRYAAEVSEDLSNWAENVVMIGTPVDNGDGTETVTFRDVEPIIAKPRKAMRVKVEIWP